MITVWIVLVVVALAFALVAIIGVRPPGARRGRRGSPAARIAKRPRRILFPFVASALSSSALDAALRLASAEGATLVPVFLARVPLNLPLQAPLPRQSESALMLLEAIEQRAAAHGVLVDARIERGRDHRHALREAIASCAYDRIVIAAAIHGCPGFDAGDVAWLLDNAPGEIVVLRSAGAGAALPPPARSRNRHRSRWWPPDRSADGGPAAARAPAVADFPADGFGSLDSDLRPRLATAADAPALVDLIRAAYRGPASYGRWTSEEQLVRGTRTDEPAVLAAIEPAGSRC